MNDAKSQAAVRDWSAKVKETARRLNEFNAQQADWYVICRKCGTRRTGSLAAVAGPCPVCAEREENAEGS